ncbi:endogenous retrovirus group K member 25 Pol protein-like, partial [Sigmodon hispidus]
MDESAAFLEHRQTASKRYMPYDPGAQENDAAMTLAFIVNVGNLVKVAQEEYDERNSVEGKRIKGKQCGNQHISNMVLATTVKLEEPLGQLRHLAAGEEDKKPRDDFRLNNSAPIFHEALHEVLDEYRTENPEISLLQHQYVLLVATADQEISLVETEQLLGTLGDLGHWPQPRRPKSAS